MKKQQTILLGIAVAVGTTVPTVIQDIPDKTVKALVTILALLVIVWASLKVDPAKVVTEVRESLRPPK